MASSLRPKRTPRDLTPDWPVDLDRVVRAHRLRNSAYSARKIIWLLGEALRTLGYEVRTVNAPVHLSQHELRKEPDASGLPPTARGRQIDTPLLVWENRIWGLDGSESWSDVLENGHAYLVDSVWDTSKNFLFRTIFSKGVLPLSPRDDSCNYRILIAALVDTMKDLGVRPGNPLPAMLAQPPTPHLDYHQVRAWIKQGEASQPLVVPDIFEVTAGGERTRAVWTREDDASLAQPLPMGIFHWPTPSVQAFFKKCQFEEVLPASSLAVSAPPRLRM